MIKRFFRVDVSLDADDVAIMGDQGDRRPIGYFRRFGCSAGSYLDFEAQIRRYIEHDIGRHVLEIEDLGDVGEEEIEDIRDLLVGDPEREGLWYQSGHAFYMSRDDSEGRDGEDDGNVLCTPVKLCEDESAAPNNGVKQVYVADEDIPSRRKSLLKRILSVLLPTRSDSWGDE